MFQSQYVAANYAMQGFQSPGLHAAWDIATTQADALVMSFFVVFPIQQPGAGTGWSAASEAS
jgi:hypothetical protein